MALFDSALRPSRATSTVGKISPSPLEARLALGLRVKRALSIRKELVIGR